MINNTYALIMAGGVGSRFWPVSTTEKPKQFLDFLGTGSTLLQQTFSRVIQITEPEKVFVATNAQYLDLVKSQLPQLPEENILLEPARRNTAACIANAVYRIVTINPDAQVLVAPSDHLILNEKVFLDQVKEALAFNEENQGLLTFGIKPSRAETGFGYLLPVEGAAEEKIVSLKQFVEKPNLPEAQRYLSEGKMFWNAGIFLFSASTIVKEFSRFLPDIHQFYAEIQHLATNELNSKVAEGYGNLTATSIDYGIMEKSDKVFMVRTPNFGWNDLGTWGGIEQCVTPNLQGNVILSGNVVAQEVCNSIIFMPKGKKALLRGLDNYIVVDSPDALLVYPKKHEQEIKGAVEGNF
ncbi:MAG: mannose-1-phosphate guanylyltransferase [Luteibaculaceae bacterium]